MSRARKIDPDAAIEAAQELFWKHGYCALGTRQIEEETGITRFTLQTSYGGKKALFLQTLDAYLVVFDSGFLPGSATDDLDTIAAWFEMRVNSEVMPDVSRYGCLMLNAIVEFQGQDEDVNQRAERYFSMLRTSFRSALSNIKSLGKLDAEFDVEAKAEILMGIALSLNVVIRSSENNEAGQHLASSTANMIRGW